MNHVRWISWVVLIALCALALPPWQAQAAVGFRVSGRNIVDANGNTFVIRGINHAHAWYPSQTGSLANIKATGANTVRVVLSGGRWSKNSSSDVANIIQLCKTNRLICVLENHDTTGYGEDSAAYTLAQAVSYWKELQGVLTGQEAYVIINIGNEPYGNNNTSAWVSDTKNAIAQLRSAGFQHMLMVDAPAWGQDWTNTMRNNAASVFSSDPNRNTVFSVHMYGVYDTSSEISSYISSFVNSGLPLVIGEFGDYHSDGNPDEDSIMSLAQSNGIGYLGWSWSGNGGGVEYLDLVTSFDPSRLTSWGNRLINGTNGIKQTSRQASVYGSTQPTATPSSGTTLFNFESGSVQSWTGSNIAGGPWSTTEWAANGSSSLKADLALGSRVAALRITQTRSLSGYARLQARVKHAAWGSMGSGLTAKLYVKTGSGWTWYDGGTTTISSGTTVLTLNLSSVANLGAVQEIGVEFAAPSNSSGSTAIYVDYVTASQ